MDVPKTKDLPPNLTELVKFEGRSLVGSLEVR